MDFWHDGQQAWKRLAGWVQGPARRSGEDALVALTDLGHVRRLLDQAEFEAVRAARRERRSWSEIAVRLGVTRQSAWERWRDVDEAPESAPALAMALEESERALSGTAGEVTSEVSGRAGRERRRAQVKVPDVIGRTWDDARGVLLSKGLQAAGPDPDGPPLTAQAWPGATVRDQLPESGAKVPPGTTVRLWLNRGDGGAGVREPRRPLPDPKTADKKRDEITEETVN